MTDTPTTTSHARFALPCQLEPKPFEATHGDEAEYARSLCDACPRLAKCQEEAPDRTTYHDGTWAGVTYRDGRLVRPITERNRGNCPTCGAVEGQACRSPKTGKPGGGPHRARLAGAIECPACQTKFLPKGNGRRVYCSDACAKTRYLTRSDRVARKRKTGLCGDCGTQVWDRAERCRSCAAKARTVRQGAAIKRDAA